MSRLFRRAALSVLLLLATVAAAQVDRAVFIRPLEVRVSPGRDAQRIGEAGRGREATILDKTQLEGSGWYKVLAGLGGGRNVTGWVLDRGLIRVADANGDRLIFGEAVDSEAEATRSRGRKGAAEDAMRLYYRVAEYWPKSPLAGEALWRAADIRWQLEKAEMSGRRSAREADPMLRPKMEEEWMKEVRKRFPGTKWADLAAFQMIDNKLCGEWQGLAKCPERESETYEEYAREHPQSPKAAEALYEAARRHAALVDIYKSENNAGKSTAAKSKAMALIKQLMSQFPQSDFAHRGFRLNYLLEQNIPTYGAGE